MVYIPTETLKDYLIRAMEIYGKNPTNENLQVIKSLQEMIKTREQGE